MKNSSNLSTTCPSRLPPAGKHERRKSGGGQNFALKTLRNDKHLDFRKPCPLRGPSPARTRPHSLHNKVWPQPLNIEKVAHTKAAATRFPCTHAAEKVHLETGGGRNRKQDRLQTFQKKTLHGWETYRCRKNLLLVFIKVLRCHPGHEEY